MPSAARPSGIPLDIRWSSDPSEADLAARFFVEHVDLTYISHSELQSGRAVAPDRWSPDLEDRIRRLALEAIGNAAPVPNGAVFRLALARREGEIAGMAFVIFVTTGTKPYAVLEDLVVCSDSRGGGVGKVFLQWIAAQCRAQGFSRLFLESGITNEAAHGFFERQGFAQVSMVMMREC